MSNGPPAAFARSFVLQFVAPCSVISYCYTRVSYVLRNRLRTRRLVLVDEASAARAVEGGGGEANGGGGASALRPQALRERDLAEIRRKRRTNRMLVSMVLVFCCCWIPLNAIHIAGDLLEKCARTRTDCSQSTALHCVQPLHYTTVHSVHSLDRSPIDSHRVDRLESLPGRVASMRLRGDCEKGHRTRTHVSCASRQLRDIGPRN